MIDFIIKKLRERRFAEVILALRALTKEAKNEFWNKVYELEKTESGFYELTDALKLQDESTTRQLHQIGQLSIIGKTVERFELAKNNDINGTRFVLLIMTDGSQYCFFPTKVWSDQDTIADFECLSSKTSIK
jgi:hypothetical protein